MMLIDQSVEKLWSWNKERVHVCNNSNILCHFFCSKLFVAHFRCRNLDSTRPNLRGSVRLVNSKNREVLCISLPSSETRLHSFVILTCPSLIILDTNALRYEGCEVVRPEKYFEKTNLYQSQHLERGNCFAGFCFCKLLRK